MKKSLLILTLCLCLLPLQVLAGPAEDYNAAMDQNINSARLQYSLSCVTDGELDENALAYLPNEWLNGNATFTISYEAENEDKIRLAAELAFTGNDGVTTVLRYWIDWDKAAQKLTYIVLPQDSDSYVYYNLNGESEQDAMMMQGFQVDAYLDAAKVTAALSGVAAQIKAQKEPTYKDGLYTVTLPEAEGKEVLASLAAETAVLFSAVLYGQAGSDEFEALVKNEIAGWFEVLAEVPLLDAEEAFTASISLDEEKNPANIRYAINFDTDIQNIIKAFAGKADTDEAMAVKATVVLEASYSQVNEPQNIVFPELTEGNSINMAQPSMPQEEPSLQQGLNIQIFGKPLITKNRPYIENERTLAPGQPLCAALGAEYQYENGVLTLEKDGNTLIFAADSAVCLVNGDEASLEVTTRVIDEELFVPVRFLAETLGYQVRFQQVMDADRQTIYASIVLIDPRKASVSILTPDENDNLEQMLQIAGAITETEANVIKSSAEQYVEHASLMLAAGESVILYDDGNTRLKDASVIADHSQIVYDLRPYLEKLSPDTLALIESDESVRQTVTGADGAIIAFPVKNGDSLELFYVSSNVANADAAVKYLHAYSEVVKALMAPAD